MHTMEICRDMALEYFERKLREKDRLIEEKNRENEQLRNIVNNNFDDNVNMNDSEFKRWLIIL